MGLLNLFSSSEREQSQRLPSGSFTLDREGKVIASTLPQGFSEERLRQISRMVLWTFKAAQSAELDLTEVVVHYAAMKLTARELRGGAIVFLQPASTESGRGKK